MKFTGIANEDRRISEELHAMGAFDQSQPDQISALSHTFEVIGQFVTWMRWKGEVSVYGCRVGADVARRMEAQRLA